MIFGHPHRQFCRAPFGAHWSRSALASAMPRPIAEIFLALAQPLRDRIAPIESPPPDADARWSATAGVPAVQRPFANTQFAGKLFRGHVFGENCADAIECSNG